MTTPGTEPQPDESSAPQEAPVSPAPVPPADVSPAPVPPADVPPTDVPAAPVPAAPVSPAPVTPAAVHPADVPPAVGEPAVVGTAEAWNRGAAAIPTPYPHAAQAPYPPTPYPPTSYPPTGSFPAGHPGGPPPSFDTPGYGYGYAAAPGWASGLDGPKAWPIAVFTVLFGILGALSAARRSSDARALGLPVGRYWGVFAGALVGSFAVWTLALGVVIAIAVPLYLNEKVTTVSGLEHEVEASGSGSAVVTDAACTEDTVDPLGVGTYQCTLTFDNGADLPYLITVSDDGSWAATALE